MECRVVYDLAGSFWSDLSVGSWLTLGLVGTIVPFGLIVAAQLPALRSAWRSGAAPDRSGQLILACVALAAATGSWLGLSNSYRTFVAIRDPYLRGHYSVLTGRVDHFQDELYHPVVPGHFSVTGHTFIWDPGGYVQVFSANTSAQKDGSNSFPPPHIGIMQDGLPIRVRYIGDRVVRLEVPASTLPPDTWGTQPCDRDSSP